MKKKQKILIAAAVGAALILLLLCCIPEFSVEELLRYTPEDPAKAMVFLLLMYALKGATLFFPVLILEIAVGSIFSLKAAFVINILGTLIILTVPYWMGRFLGLHTIEKLISRYPKLQTIVDRQQGNSFFLCFFLRVISCLPGDFVTMYLGAIKMPFWKNLIAGCFGVLPGMTLATLIGESIQDPSSPMFWISLILTILISALSMLFYYWKTKKEETV